MSASQFQGLGVAIRCLQWFLHRPRLFLLPSSAFKCWANQNMGHALRSCSSKLLNHTLRTIICAGFFGKCLAMDLVLPTMSESASQRTSVWCWNCRIVLRFWDCLGILLGFCSLGAEGAGRKPAEQTMASTLVSPSAGDQRVLGIAPAPIPWPGGFFLRKGQLDMGAMEPLVALRAMASKYCYPRKVAWNSNLTKPKRHP